MRKVIKFFVGSAAGIFLLLAVGFLLFVHSIQHQSPPSVSRADGIVVLTGGDKRIAEAVRLLAVDKAERLLITGVNRRTSRRALIRQIPQRNDLFRCCIDIGYEARDTIGNADEARQWVLANKFRRIIVVTASYHMPRSLAELSRALPHVDITPYPVVPESFHLNTWWSHPGTIRLLLTEYVKFIPAAARFRAARFVDSEQVRDRALTNPTGLPKF